MKRILAALLAALALAACSEVAETTDATTAAEITEVVTAAETTTQTTAETTTEEITAAETTAVITTEETTAEITTEATTAATTVATTTAATTTVVTTTEATTEETTTAVEETTAPAAPEIFSFEESDLADYVLLGKYLGIEVHIPAPDPVSDGEVEEEIDKVIETLPAEAMLYTRACVEGDKVNINFVGTIDGVPFEGGSGENITLVLGEGKFVPGFEEGILGMLPGDVFPVNVVFPEDYYEEYASKAAEFEITLNYIYPKLTDAIAAEYFGYESAAAVRANVRAALESDAYSALDSEKEKAAWTKVLANSSVVIYPEEKLSAAFEAQVNMYKELAASYNMTYEELFTAGYGITVDEAEEILFEGAKNSVKQQLVLYSIARAEGVPLDDAAYEADMLSLAEGYGLASVDELLAAIGYTKSELKEIIIYTGIISKIIENANFVEISN